MSDLIARAIGVNNTTQLAERVKGTDVVTNAQTDGVNTKMGHSTNAIANDVSTSVILGGGSTGYNNVIGGDGANVNTTTPNTTTTGTGAHVSVVGGYDNSAGQLSSKIISDRSKTEIGGAGHNAIYGGANHIIKSTAKFSMIAGGQENELSNQYTFATGYLNKVSGQSGFASGDHNNVTGNFSKASGTTNTVSGIGSEVHGSTNTASGNYGSAKGNYAHSRFVGQHAFTGGRFTALGDAQTSVMEMHKQTTDATATTLGVLGSNTSYQLQFKQSVAFSILLVARDTAGTDTASWEIKGMARRGETGNTVPVGATITSLGADAGTTAWVVAVTGDSAGGLNVRITGEAGKTIRWVQRMTLTEVMI
jgi:hypothetical protein